MDQTRKKVKITEIWINRELNLMQGIMYYIYEDGTPIPGLEPPVVNFSKLQILSRLYWDENDKPFQEDFYDEDGCLKEQKFYDQDEEI